MTVVIINLRPNLSVEKHKQHANNMSPVVLCTLPICKSVIISTKIVTNPTTLPCSLITKLKATDRCFHFTGMYYYYCYHVIILWQRLNGQCVCMYILSNRMNERKGVNCCKSSQRLIHKPWGIKNGNHPRLHAAAVYWDTTISLLIQSSIKPVTKLMGDLGALSFSRMCNTTLC